MSFGSDDSFSIADGIGDKEIFETLIRLCARLVERLELLKLSVGLISLVTGTLLGVEPSKNEGGVHSLLQRALDGWCGIILSWLKMQK